jgi:hypothetical protein
MKFLLLPILLLVFIKASAQSDTAIVTLNGIGDIKLEMKLQQVEKILNHKITLHHPERLKQDNETDTVQIQDKGVAMEVVFRSLSREITVQAITSYDPKLRTRSGIRIGDDKYKIIRAYEQYSLFITPEYNNENNWTRSKTKSLITLEDKSSMIQFYLTNNKLVGIKIQNIEGD